MRAFEDQDSSLLSVFAAANALIRLLPDAPAQDEGALVDVLPLESMACMLSGDELQILATSFWVAANAVLLVAAFRHRRRLRLVAAALSRASCCWTASPIFRSSCRRCWWAFCC